MSGSGQTVLVTGAGGFIGSHLVRHLRRNPAMTTVAATRDGRDGTRRMDLADPSSFAAGLSGMSAVVHCAVGNRAVTVDGTRALLAAAAAAGVRRFIYLSSVAVYGAATGTVTEATPLVPPDGAGYPAWKAAAEACCAARTEVEVVRLRPAIVYGPGSALWVTQLAHRVRSGHWGTFFEAGDGICNLVHVRDVVSGVEKALTQPAAAGAAFNLSGAEAITWNDWFNRMAAGLGAPALRAIGPFELWARVYGSLPLKAAARLRPGLAAGWLLGAPARSEVALFSRRVTYSIDAAKTALGWSPQVGIDEGLADCIAWLRDGQGVRCT